MSTEASAVPGARLERATALGLTALLLGATLGEGGGHPVSLVAWHAGVVALLLWVVAIRAHLASPTCCLGSPAVPGALFLLLAGAGALRAPYAYAAIGVLLEVACCAAVAWIAGSVGARGLRTIAPPLQVGAAAHGLWAVGQWLLDDARRPASSFLVPNHMALWLVAASLLALGGIGVGDGRIDRLRPVLLTLPALAAVVLSGSRGAAFGLVAGGAWLLWARRADLPRLARHALPAGLLLCVALLGARVAWRGESDPFRYHRLRIWSASATVLAEAPAWGTGPGQFETAAANLAFPDGDGPLCYDRAFGTTHSDLLRLPAEFGLPAALAALVAAGLAVLRVAERRRHGTLPTGAAGAVAALVAIGAHGLVDNPSTWPAVYVLGSALAGFLLAREGAPVPRVSAAARLALAGALGGAFLVGDVAPFLAWREARGLARGAASPADAERLERAIRWNPIHAEYRLRLAEHLAGNGTAWTVDRYAAAREAAEHAVRLDPNSARCRRGLARVEARACRLLFPDVACRERVHRQFLAAESRARFDPSLPVNLAAFLLESGDAAGARRAAERALALEPEAALPRLLLADALIEGRTAEGAARAAVLVAEARERAARWSAWSDPGYGRPLLAPDPAIVEQLERKLEAAAWPALGRPTP